MSIDVQSALIAVFVLIAVAVEMMLRRRRRRADVLFVVLTTNLVLWFLATFLGGLGVATDLFVRIQLGLAALVPATLLRLFVDLVRGGASRSARRLITAAYPLSGLVALTAMSPLGDLLAVRALTGAYVASMILLTSRMIVQSAPTPQGTVEFARLRYLAIGAVATTALVILGRMPFLGENAMALGHLVVMVYVFFLSQAIARERLLDLHEFISRMVVLAVLALLFAAISSVFNVMGSSTPAQVLFNTVISVIIILTLYEPLKDRLEAKTIELFFRERYDMARLLESLRHRMLRVLDPNDMSKLVLDTLYDARRVTHAAVYLLEPLGRGFALQGFRGPEPGLRVDERELPALWHALQTSRSPLLAEQLSGGQDDGSESKSNRDLIEALRRVSADILFPFASGDRVLGFLAIRDDRVPEPYSTEEIALLMSIAEAAVTVIENSELAARLRERDRLAAIGEMAAGLAHEIRNPLGAIKGAAEYLDPKEGPAGSEEAEFLQIIIEETNRLNGVVTQFLDYARPFRAQLATCDLNDLVRRTAKLVEAQGHATPIELDLDERVPEIEIDAEQFKQVILNLLLNGVEASAGARAPVRVVTRYIEERERVELSVVDRGAGIPREELDHIFIPFFTTKTQGTGLGLAVCQRIVTNHGGIIDVQSKLDEGTEFTIRLPRFSRKKETQSTTGSFPGRTGLRPRRIEPRSQPAPKRDEPPQTLDPEPEPAQS